MKPTRHRARTPLTISLASAVLLTAGALLVPTAAQAASVKAATVRKEAVAGKDQAVAIQVKKKKKAKKKTPEGWQGKLSLGATTSMVHTYQVTGVENGLSFSIGAVANGEARYQKGPHAFITTLAVAHAWSKTPTITPFVKTADELNLASRYEYRFRKAKSMALYGALQLVAPMAPGDLVAAQDTDLIYIERDGTQRSGIAPKDQRVRLTWAFSPLIFKQLLGATARPHKSEIVQLDVRLALAGQEVWANGYTIADDKATPALELTALRNYQQMGLQLEADLGGKIKKNLVYAFHMELMYPFVTSIHSDLSGFDLLNTVITFKLGLKIAKWASLEYVFGAKRLPLIVNQWQVTNNLVLSLVANIL